MLLFIIITIDRVVSFLRYRSKKIVIKYFNYYQLVTFNIIKVLVNIIWKTIFLSINFGLNKKSSETGVSKFRHAWILYSQNRLVCKRSSLDNIIFLSFSTFSYSWASIGKGLVSVRSAENRQKCLRSNTLKMT